MLTHCFFIVYIYCGWLFFISLLLVSVLLAIFSFLIFRMLYHLLWVLLSQLLNYLTILLLFLFNIRFKRDGRIYFLYLISWVIWFSSPLGVTMLLGWAFCFYFHLCNGIRHLFWDIGWGFELETAYRSGWLVVGVTLGLTVLTFWWML